MAEKHKALGVDIFAGGFTVGVRKHFNVLAHWEESNYGVSTAQKNFPKLPIYYGTEKWPVEDPQFNELDFIYGNPPCAAWSVAGYTKTRGTDKWKTDERVSCTVRHFALIEKLRPKVWVWESVTQAYSKGQEFVRTLEEQALRMGYNVYYVLHDSQWLGVAQSRKRFFMVCSRIEINWPTPNWSPPTTVSECLSEITPTRLDWTVKIEPLVAKYLDNTYFDMPPGMRFRTYWEQYVPKKKWKIGDRGQIIGRPSFGHKRLPIDKPSDVIVGYALIHPTEKRFVTINEMAALCGFPPDYEFVANSPGAAASLIARGVCPPVGEWLARTVSSALNRGKEVEEPKAFHVELRQQSETGEYLFELDPKRPVQEQPAAKVKGSDPKEKKERRPVQMEMPVNLKPGSPVPKPGKLQGRMSYLQQLIMMDRWTAEQLVQIIHYHWPTSKASKADVSTQRGELRKMKRDVPDPIRQPREKLRFK